MATRQADIKNTLLCCGIVTVAMLIARPFADLGYADDPAYAHVALVLTRTGHLLYDGWESAFLVLHAYWGALFIRVFGFSFVCVRLSTIPFALGSVGLCYALVRRAGLQARDAFLVTLLFGLSPLFLPLAVSFMTDVPALFFMFASLYAFVRAEEASDGRGGYAWLMLGVTTGFLGGTTRQVVWLVPLIVLPYLAWVRRHHKRLSVSAVIAWFLVLGGVIYTTRWFNHQPYTVFQPSVFSESKLLLKRPLWAINVTARLGLMLMLVILPAATPLLLRSLVDTWREPRGRQILVAALLLLVLTAVLIHPSLASIPWVASTLNWQGINGSSPLPGRPVVLVTPVRAVVALAVYAAVCLLSGELFRLRRVERRAILRALDSPADRFPLMAMSLVSIVYFVLLVVRSADFDIFDRYLLPIMPWAATVMLLWFEKDNPGAERMIRRTMPFAWALLAVLAFYGVAGTQDYWSLAEARVLAAGKLEAAGAPRTAIDGGFEYNAWTELQIDGRLNSRWVLNPPGAYRPGLSQTPSVVPEYRLEYKPTEGTAPSEFGSVPYFSLLPPFHKRVGIDRVVAPSSSN
jgi:4-amino-4-deoxy-L-arabinose transferase-like glycosyltransferase